MAKALADKKALKALVAKEAARFLHALQQINSNNNNGDGSAIYLNQGGKPTDDQKNNFTGTGAPKINEEDGS